MYDLVTDGGIPYELIEGYPKFSFKQSEITGSEQYIMPWYEVGNFAEETFHYSHLFGSYAPRPRTMPGFNYLYSDEISVEPFIEGKPGGNGISYGNIARVTISYKTLSAPEDQGQAEFSRTVSFGGEFVTIPGNRAKWYSDGVTVDEEGDVQVGVVVPTVEHSLQWERVLDVPWSAIRACIGKVNGSTFVGASTETLLFVGAEITSKSSLGRTMYDIQYKLSERPSGWNKFLRASTGTFERIVFKNGVNPYSLTDLSILFV